MRNSGKILQLDLTQTVVLLVHPVALTYRAIPSHVQLFRNREGTPYGVVVVSFGSADCCTRGEFVDLTSPLLWHVWRAVSWCCGIPSGDDAWFAVVQAVHHAVYRLEAECLVRKSEQRVMYL